MKNYPRVLTVQDISCVGQCSLTVALPVISAMGAECCVFPTAVLSAHTGFPNPEIRQLESPEGFWEHWLSCGVEFDCIYTGYLGNVPAVEAVRKYARRLLCPDGLLVVDPAMADGGRLYKGLDSDYAREMSALVAEADVILPNLTEAQMLTGLYEKTPEELLSALPAACAVLTGAEQGEKIGVCIRDEDKLTRFFHEKLPGRYSGTGDLFAAAFTGAVSRGWAVENAAILAEKFTIRCIRATRENPAHGYGIRFEPELAWLATRQKT